MNNLFLCLLVSMWVPISVSSTINIFILGGQSNMAGRGGVTEQLWDGIVPPECLPDPSILRFSADTLAWAEAGEPLHAGIDSTAGVGPGMAFARAVLQGGGIEGKVGLVPCAMGGTNISRWEKGGALYRRMIRRARAASTNTNGGSVSVSALLWYQGESDTVYKRDAESYGRRLDKLFQDVRMDLMSPMLPIIQVGLASGEGPFVDIVREAQFGTNLLNVRTVDAKGLALQSDKLHLTTESQVRLGKMMAEAFFQFMPSHISAATVVNTTVHTSDSAFITNFSNCIIFIITTLIPTVY